MRSVVNINRFSIIILTFIIYSNPVIAQWNKALHFTYMEHDYLIADTGSVLWPTTVNAGTLEMWFRPDSILKSDTHPPDYTFLFAKNLSGNVAGDMGLTWKRDYGTLQGFIQDGTATTDVFTDQEIWQPRWTHVAFQWDTNDSMRIFINGVQSSDFEPNTAGETCPPVEAGAHNLIIGSGSANLLYSRYETFRGQIDEVRLSAIARYTADFTPATEPFEVDAYTMALWHFDEGTGDVASDATGNGFDAILGDPHPDSSAVANPEWVDVVYDRKIMINEVLTDPQSDDANTVLVEGDSNADSVRHPQHDEFVELLNITGDAIDMTGWKVADDEEIDWQFPDGYMLQPYEFVTIFGGPPDSLGGDSLVNVNGWDADSLETRVFSTGGYIGNGLANGGDYLIIQSANGDHDMYLAYGSKYGNGPPTSAAVTGITWEFPDSTNTGTSDNSITRNPDADPDAGFEEHMLAAGDSLMRFSPNATIYGNPTLAFPVTVSVSGSGGTYTVNPDIALHSIGSTVSVTAVPDSGYVFDHWEIVGASNYVNPLSHLVAGATSIQLYFEEAYQMPHTIIFNEVNADPASDPINGDANGDGVRNSVHDEFVELVNVGSDTVDMTGWMLGDDERINYTFPDNYKIAPGHIVVLFGSVNHTDNANVAGYNTDILLSSVLAADTVGNGVANGGEYVVLKSPDGTYDTYVAYGSKYQRGPPQTSAVEGITFEMRVEIGDTVGNNNSVTRNPDGDTTALDPFRQHLRVNDAYFSPGTTIDGALWLSLVDQRAPVPELFSLRQNYPNPFNPVTNIEFKLPVTSDVRLSIYNFVGQEINTLVNERTAPGTYRVTWNGLNSHGQQVSTGVYFYRLETDQFMDTKKMVIIK